MNDKIKEPTRTVVANSDISHDRGEIKTYVNASSERELMLDTRERILQAAEEALRLRAQELDIRESALAQREKCIIERENTMKRKIDEEKENYLGAVRMKMQRSRNRVLPYAWRGEQVSQMERKSSKNRKSTFSMEGENVDIGRDDMENLPEQTNLNKPFPDQISTLALYADVSLPSPLIKRFV